MIFLVVLTFEIFSFHEDLYRFSFALNFLCVLGCSRVLILFLLLTLFSHYFSP